MIILIAGKKRSGKNYVANLLHKQIKNSEIIAFADEMKKILAVTLDISLDDLDRLKSLEAPLYIKDGDTYKSITNFRKVLQHFGTDAMQKSFGKNVWTDVILKKYFLDTAKTLIIPDLRFRHEFDNLKQLNPFTILVQGGNSKDDHISEHDLIDFKFDYIIDNTKKCDISFEITDILGKIRCLNQD